MPANASDKPLRVAGLEILAASSVALFQELAFIRWLPGEVRVLAYFPNLVLIAAFLGLGLGSLRSRSRSLLLLWPISLVLVVGAGVALGKVAFTGEGVTEHLWLLYEDLPEGARVVEGIRAPLVVMFLLVTASFVPLGQVIGASLQRFAGASRALKGYAADLGGSLAGVVLFSLVSYGSLRPLWWFAPFLAAGFYLMRARPARLLAHATAAVIVLGAVAAADDADRYSPYYALSAVPTEGLPDVRIRANGSLHQIAADLEAFDIDLDWRLDALNGYRIPHRSLGRPIRKALVLGAGTGNDVAVLLSEGAQEVHAIEIDPGIIELGREVHPNRPYDDPRVTVHNVDARTFLNETGERFDLIVFGTLDSMTRLSALSSVRLDNFVYTAEALAAARARLTDDGGLALYFMVGEPYIHEHLLTLLWGAFGEVPATATGSYSMFNSLYMAGPGFSHLDRATVSATFAEMARDPGLLDALPTDDWPFLYLPRRGITSFYLSMMAVFAGLATVLVFGLSPTMRGSLRRGGIDIEMFLYGAAFLLMETKFVTSMNLLWGATWITSAVVFGAILLTVLGGTLLRDRTPISWRTAGGGLALSLVLVYFVPVSALLSAEPALRLLMSVAYVGTPIFFAALCFADRFQARDAVDAAFGWNLMGAVCGGLIEFFSMSTGFASLTLVALAAYLVAFLVAARQAGSGNAALAASVP